MEPFLEPLLRELRIRKVIKKIPQNGMVCDVCCGGGTLLFRISSKIGGGVGLDRKIENKKENNILFKDIDLDEEIPEESGVFDCVTLLAAIEHLPNPGKIMCECFRILRSGGKILITTPSPVAKPILEFLSFGLGIVSPEHIKEHKYYFKENDLISLCETAGFRKENIFIKRFQFWCNIFLECVKQ